MTKKKGTVSSYNQQDVQTRDYYYDRETTDSNIQKSFGDMFKDLEKFNKKLTKELEKGEKAEFKLTKDK